MARVLVCATNPASWWPPIPAACLPHVNVVLRAPRPRGPLQQPFPWPWQPATPLLPWHNTGYRPNTLAQNEKFRRERKFLFPAASAPGEGVHATTRRSSQPLRDLPELLGALSCQTHQWPCCAPCCWWCSQAPPPRSCARTAATVCKLALTKQESEL